jgi:FAD/FMN-containing dehydrogenase
MLSRQVLADFRGRFQGEVVFPGDPAYDRARAVWNATADGRPVVVARCTGPQDVAVAVRLARERELVVAVRGGAHSYPGFSTCDGGIVIDLSPMGGVLVDPAARVATAGGGALLGELDRQAQAFGLACPTGHVSHTGVGGLTLGGGVGRLARKHGLTVDNLLAVELVTAGGEQVRASPDEHPELFWGLRGAGANFGVATAFELALHPVGPVVLAGMAVFPVERAREVGAAFAAWAASAPDEVTAGMGYFAAPAGPPFPPAVAGRPVVVVQATHTGPPDGAERDLAPLRALGPVLDTFGPRSYLELQRESDEHYRWGKRNYWKGLLLEALHQDAVDTITDRLGAAPGPDCGVGLLSLGGAFGRVPEDATAFSGRGAALWLITEAVWLDPASDEAHMAWGRDAMAALEPFATSVNYVNDLGQLDQDAVRGAYGPAKYERLVALKRTWDPDNVFRRNQNIRP